MVRCSTGLAQSLGADSLREGAASTRQFSAARWVQGCWQVEALC